LENWVITEFIKIISTCNKKVTLSFWRTSNGAEVDLIIEKGLSLIPVEIKSSVKLPGRTISNLSNFMDSLKTKRNIPFAVIFYMGNEIYRVTKKIVAIPINRI